MATIVERKNKFTVVYYYENEKGVKQQKWETFDTKAAAKKRKIEVEHQMQNGTFTVPSAKTVADLLEEYVSVYGVNSWSMSTYDGIVSLINNYILPIIGSVKLPKVVFHSLRHTSTTYKLKLTHGDIKAVQGDTGHSQTSMVTDRYAHIIDADRKVIAEKMEAKFFSGAKANDVKQVEQSEVSSEDQELIMQLLANPQAMTLLKTLFKYV